MPQPTYGDYLLDLVLTDLDSLVTSTVYPGISDHDIVSSTLNVSVPQPVRVTRWCWNYAQGNTRALKSHLRDVDWHEVLRIDASANALDVTRRFTSYVLQTCARFIPYSRKVIEKGAHPWLDDQCRRSLADKHAAFGSPDYLEKCQACSSAISKAYSNHQARIRRKLASRSTDSKLWWKLSRSLMFNSKGGSSIPPLKSGAEWVLSSDGKAELLADTFVKKWNLIPRVGASDLSSLLPLFRVDRSFVAIRVRDVKRVLLELDDSTATGPDLLPTRILRMLADALAIPVTLLCRFIFNSASWPWRVHWIVPIYKRLSPSQPGNYRGVHLTPALSKVAERVLDKRVRDFFEYGDGWGDSQFAYRSDHSFSDVLALLVALWICALDRGQKVSMF